MEHLAQLTSVTELLKALFETGASFIAFISALWLVGKKVMKSVDRYTSQVDLMTKEFAEVKAEFIEVKANQKQLAECQIRLTAALDAFGSKIEEREKDTMRLEGALDATRKDLMQLVGGSQQILGSLDGVWRTLQVLHPTEVPKRASDKR